jgi:transketolase
VQVLDDKNVRRRFRASNYQSTTRVKPFICTMPMRLDEGWNQIQFNLSDFTRRAYGTNYIETLRVQIHANCRIRRIYFSDRLYSEEELLTYGMPGSRIEESPLEGIPGFEITGGSLGQGLSQAIGMALAARMRGEDTTIYCLLSDGELQEGQVWEAAMSAGHYRLGNLVVLVDNNGMQADGNTAEVMTVEPVPAKFEAFGFDAVRIDANDHAELLSHLPEGGVTRDRPLALVCENLPGKGVPSFEQYAKVHYIRAPKETWELALAELDA